MKRTLLPLLVSLIAFPVLAAECDDLSHLGALYEVRSLMMHRSTSSSDVQSFIDRRIDELREPIPDGGYRWVRYVRPSGDGPTDKHVHSVRSVHDTEDPDSFEATGHHAYAVRIVVPSKRSLFKGNNPVFVGDVRVETNNGRSRPRADVIRINRWMKPDTAQTFDLQGIYDTVIATAPVSVDARDRNEAVAEIHFVQAVAQDDPANPAYPTIKALGRIREYPDPATVDSEIAALENTVFPGVESVPLLTILHDLRRADELIRSEKADDQEKGNRLLKETLRRLR
jgi:hypothetical protein